MTFGLALLVVAGCGGGGDGTDASDASPADTSSADTSRATAESRAESAASAVRIEVGERSPAFEGAQARFTAPADSVVVDSASVDVTVAVENYELGVQTETDRAATLANSANGQHVHIIVDGGPYYANYEAGTPFPLDSLSTGAHSAVVFPSRSYHESVKGADAYDIVNFYVNEETGTFPLDPSQPTIVYSRPKGTYSGAGAERIMMDFYLHNVELSDGGYRAQYEIREQGSEEVLASITMTEWTPAFVTGLASGTYIFHLQLLDADGNVVPGTFNDTEREVTVEASAETPEA
jgi:hypothetical protein